MNEFKIYKNSDIKSLSMGVPAGHRHIRTSIETPDGVIVLQEATVAAIVRAYTTIKTHPVTNSIKLTGQELTDTKKGYASFQLMETDDKDLLLPP
jgi:hypothetical protein